VLSALDKVLDEYNGLDNSSKSFGDKSRKVLKRFKWDPDEIRDLRSRISSTIGLLNAFSISLTKYLFMTQD